MSSDIQETADDLNNHFAADRKTGAGEIGPAAKSTSNDRQRRAAEISRIEPKSKARTLRSRIEACYQSLTGILATLIAVLFVSLLFLFQSVTSFLSRK
jgi:hypothetical protein